MTFGSRHSALLAEYQTLMDEEIGLWNTLSHRFAAMEADDGDVSDSADYLRWFDVRERRAVLDQAIDALARPRSSAWGELMSEAA